MKHAKMESEVFLFFCEDIYLKCLMVMLTFQILWCPGSVFSLDTCCSSIMRGQIEFWLRSLSYNTRGNDLAHATVVKDVLADLIVEMPIGTCDS